MSAYRDLVRLDIRTIKDYEKHRFTVLDFETNGLMGSACEVIEFAAVKVAGGRLTTQVSSLCAASAPLSPFITKLTGIKDRQLIGKPSFDDFVEPLVEYIGDDILVAHNAPFDVPILLQYCRRNGVGYSPAVLCTLASARRLFPDFPNHKLSTLGELFGLYDGRAHRALADTLATARLLLVMFEYLRTGSVDIPE